ncbi:hypothetical protein MTO96_006336 [Rhipicephalus appendiculatus]
MHTELTPETEELGDDDDKRGRNKRRHRLRRRGVRHATPAANGRATSAKEARDNASRRKGQRNENHRGAGRHDSVFFTPPRMLGERLPLGDTRI